MRMVNNYSVLGTLACTKQLAALAIEENYDIETLRETTEVDNPQRETNIVIGLYDMIDGIGAYEKEIMDKYDQFLPEIVDLLKRHYNYKFIRIKSFSFIRMKAGHRIYDHKDDDAVGISTAYDYCHRIHLPLVTNDKVLFTIDGETRHLKYGEMIEIDNLKTHSVVNDGENDRIHLLIDFYGLDGYYDSTLSPIPKEFYKE